MSLSWKPFIMLHLVAHMKSDRNSCIANEKRWCMAGVTERFLAMLECGSRDGSVGLSTILVQTEISQELLDGLSWNFVQAFL